MNTTTYDRTALVARRIREARHHRGWTLSDLSAHLPADGPNLSSKLLSKVETGTRELSVAELSAIAGALSIVPEHLMRDGELCATCGQEIQS